MRWAVAGSLAVVACAAVGFATMMTQRNADRADATSAAPRTQEVVDSTRSRHLVARDDGAHPYASGSASSIGAGRFAYTAEPGDTLLGIASRFHVCVDDVAGGFPLAAQGHGLTAGLALIVELGPWPLHEDGTVDCVEDGTTG